MNKTEVIRIRIEPDDKVALKQAAGGESMSAAVRQIIRGVREPIKAKRKNARVQ